MENSTQMNNSGSFWKSLGAGLKLTVDTYYKDKQLKQENELAKAQLNFNSELARQAQTLANQNNVQQATQATSANQNWITGGIVAVALFVGGAVLLKAFGGK